jgi:hypothetical protein
LLVNSLGLNVHRSQVFVPVASDSEDAEERRKNRFCFLNKAFLLKDKAIVKWLLIHLFLGNDNEK